jgi:beta-phosphoglucomutase family hydrolase/Cof subfamily protein (haloacid dehalogenase superfamily)
LSWKGEGDAVVKLLISDVDGTLVTQAGALTARAIEAVARLRAANVQFTVASSRPPRGLATLVERLQITAPIAAFNGGMIVRPDLTTVIEQRIIPLAVALQTLDILIAGRLDVWVYRGADWFVRDRRAPHVAKEQATVQFAPTEVLSLAAVLDGAVKIVGVSDDHERIERSEAELRHQLGTLASASRSHPYYVEVTHPQANKGEVVRLASRVLQIPTDEIAVIGDMATDVLMFAVAGTSIAMGNADSEVKRSARFVTTSNEEEGFANAVERLVLGRPGTAQAALGLPGAIRACLFDLDGVLTQTAKVHAAAWKQMFDEFLQERSAATGQPFVPFDPVADYNAYVDGKLRIDGARSFLASRSIDLPEETVRDLAARKDDLMVQIMNRDGVEAYDGSVRYLHAVRDAGLRTAVVSSSKHCREVLDSAGIADLFDVRVDGVVASQEHLAGKPAPDTFLAAAHEIGLEPSEAVVFEDALSGVEAGRAGHFGYVVGVDRVGQAGELRRHGADVVVTDLAALLEHAPG